MVSPYGSVRDVYLSPKKDAPFIVHIQDGHGIEEAQRNISSMIEIMGQEPKIQLVGLEAAWGPFSLQPYRDYPDANITKEIADFFLKKGLIAGPEYAGLTLPTAPDFFGAEDKTLYDANVLALKTAYKTKKAALTQLGVVVNNVGVLKSQRYSDQLKTFDGHFEGYHSEKEKLAVYVRYLVETHRSLKIPHPALRGPSDPGPIRPVANASHWQARPFPQEGKENRDFPSPLGRLVAERPAPGAPEALMRGQGEGSVPNLELLVRALDEEDRLNFKLVEKERRDLVEQLANKLNVQQMQDLVAKSVDYRAGRVGYGDYHSHLIEICRQHGISVGQWGHLNRYISYVTLADKIDKNSLLEEMDLLDRAIPERLARTSDEKKLVSVAYDLTLMAKLLRHEMAPTDWAAYEKRAGEIHRLGDRLSELDPTGKWESLSAKTLKPFEDFCRYATQRNNALTDNLLRRMGETQAKSAVLVAGGFHTEGLSALLRDKQVSYVVLTPKITEIPRDNKYLDLLASDPVPLEKQLAGDRIYLAKVVGMTEKSTARLMAAIQQVAQLKKALVDMGNGYAITTDESYKGARVLLTLGDGRNIFLVTNYRQEKPFLNFSSRIVNGSISFIKALATKLQNRVNAIPLPATIKEDTVMLLGALGLFGGPMVSFGILLLLHVPNAIRIISDQDSSTSKKILRLATLLAALTIFQLLWIDWAGPLDTISNFKALEVAGEISLFHFVYSQVAKSFPKSGFEPATSDILRSRFEDYNTRTFSVPDALENQTPPPILTEQAKLLIDNNKNYIVDLKLLPVGTVVYYEIVDGHWDYTIRIEENNMVSVWLRGDHGRGMGPITEIGSVKHYLRRDLKKVNKMNEPGILRTDRQFSMPYFHQTKFGEGERHLLSIGTMGNNDAFIAVPQRITILLPAGHSFHEMLSKKSIIIVDNNASLLSLLNRTFMAMWHFTIGKFGEEWVGWEQAWDLAGDSMTKKTFSYRWAPITELPGLPWVAQAFGGGVTAILGSSFIFALLHHLRPPPSFSAVFKDASGVGGKLMVIVRAIWPTIMLSIEQFIFIDAWKIKRDSDSGKLVFGVGIQFIVQTLAAVIINFLALSIGGDSYLFTGLVAAGLHSTYNFIFPRFGLPALAAGGEEKDSRLNTEIGAIIGLLKEGRKLLNKPSPRKADVTTVFEDISDAITRLKTLSKNLNNPRMGYQQWEKDNISKIINEQIIQKRLIPSLQSLMGFVDKLSASQEEGAIAAAHKAIDLIGPHFDMYSDYERQNAPTPTEMHEKLDRKALERIASKKNVTADSVLSVAQDIRLSNSQVELLETLGAIERSGLKPSFPLMEVVGKNTGDFYRALWEDTKKIIGSVYRPQFEADETEVSKQLSDLTDVLQMIIEDNKEGNATDFRRKYPNVDAFISDLSNFSDAPAPLAKLWFGMSETEYARFVDNLFLTEISKGQVVIDGWKIFYHRDAFNGKLFPLNAIKALVKKFASDVEQSAQQRGGDYSKKGILRDDFAHLFWGFVKKDLVASEITILWFGTGQEAHANVSTDANSNVAETVFQRADSLNGENRLPLMGSEAPKKGSPVRGAVGEKPAATIKALMPLYHWMGRAFNPDWSRIPANEKLEQIIEVYAPVVESVLFGVVFGGTLALLGFLGIDLSTLQTVGLWGAFNGIFALSHRTFYVLENGEWKEKSLADVGKSTHLTLWAASLGVHLPLLGMLLTPAAFSVPFFLAVFVSSALSSGFHRFYNKWVARPLGLPALTGVRSDFNRARSLLFLLLKDLDDRDVFRIHSELITRYPSYKESAGELNSAASISTFWNQHLATTVGRSNDDSWTDFKNSLLSLSNPRISYIQDDPFSSGGFGEARLIKINGKDFILKTARHGQDKIPLLDAIFNIGSLLYEEKQLKSMKKLIKENKIPHVVPIHVGGGISNGRNFIVMERIKGENLNANSQISLQEALRIIDAVRWFHKNNKVHGDLKPLNIMIASEGAFLLDLGTTKQVGTKIAWDNVSTQEFSTGLDETRRGKNFNTDIYQLAATLVTAMNEDDLTRPKIFRVLERALTGFELPTHTAFPTGFDTSEFRPSAEEMYVEFIRSIEDQEQPEPNPFNKQKMIGELQIAKAWNWAEMQTLNGGVNNIFYFVLRFFTSEKFAKAWGMRLLPVEISVLGWAGWMASGWAQAVFGALALDPTFMGAALMAAGILVFRGLHFALDKVWARTHPAQGPPSTTFWLNTARMMPYAMLPVLAASPVAFLVAFFVLAYDHFAFDLKQLLNRDLPLSNTAKLLVVSMVSATFAVVIAPIIVSNLASPMGTFFLVSLAAQVFDPVTMQSFSENPASGLFALSVGTVSNFSTYALSMGWAPMALLGFATSALLSNTRWLPSLSVAQNYLSAYGRLGENHSLNTYSSIEDYESFLIDGPHSLLTRGRLARNLEIARHTSGVKSVFYLGAGTDLTHVLTSFPDATHVTLSGNNYGTITAESIKNAMTTSHGLTGRSNELLTAYKESVSNNGFAGTSLVQNPVMQSSFLALELLSLGVQVGTIRSESGGGISFEVPGLLGRPSRRVSIVFKNNAFNGSPVQMNTGEQIYDGFFAKAIDGIQPYFMGVFSALADRLSSSLTVVSDRAVPDNMDDIGFREISKVTVSDEDSGSYGNAFQVVKLNRFPTPPKENELAAKSVVALIESRKLAKLAINLKYNFEGTDYRPTFELQGETSRNDIDSAIRILGAANVSVQVAEEYGRQLALAEGNGTQKVAVLHGIASWEEKTRTIALAVVRGMLMAGKPVLIVAEAGFDTAIINYSGQTPIEVLNIAELNADLMNTVETQRSNRDVPLASTVLIREEDRAVLDGTNYSALTFEGISRAIQNALETLIATLRAA
jgi:serine/threonine protein kinase